MTADSTPIRAGGRSVAVLCAILVAGAVLRLYRVANQGLWYDEAVSVWIARSPLHDITDAVLRMDASPPLYHYLLHGWFALFGAGDFQARLFSAVAGTLAIPFMYLFGARLVNPTVGLLSSLLLAMSQIGIAYSQEVRPYALVLLLSLISAYLLILSVQQRRPYSFVAAVLAATMMTFTHYYGALISAALVLYVWLTKRKHSIPAWWPIGGVVFASALLGPWLWVAWNRQEIAQQLITAEKPPWFAIHWRTPVSTLISFNNGRVNGLLNSSSAWAYLAGGMLFFLPAVMSCMPAGRVGEKRMLIPRDSRLLLGLLLAVPLASAWSLAALLGLDYHLRYVAACIVPYYLFIATGWSATRIKTLRWGWIAMSIVFSLWALRANYFIRDKEDYRGAQQYVAAQRAPADVHVFLPWDDVPLVWKVYESIEDIRYSTLDDVLVAEAEPRVWVIMYQRVATARQTCEKQKRRMKAAYDKVDAKQFFWIEVELYVSRKAVVSRRQGGRFTETRPAVV